MITGRVFYPQRVWNLLMPCISRTTQNITGSSCLLNVWPSRLRSFTVSSTEIFVSPQCLPKVIECMIRQPKLIGERQIGSVIDEQASGGHSELSYCSKGILARDVSFGKEADQERVPEAADTMTHREKTRTPTRTEKEPLHITQYRENEEGFIKILPQSQVLVEIECRTRQYQSPRILHKDTVNYFSKVSSTALPCTAAQSTSKPQLNTRDSIKGARKIFIAAPASVRSPSTPNLGELGWWSRKECAETLQSRTRDLHLLPNKKVVQQQITPRTSSFQGITTFGSFQPPSRSRIEKQPCFVTEKSTQNLVEKSFRQYKIHNGIFDLLDCGINLENITAKASLAGIHKTVNRRIGMSQELSQTPPANPITPAQHRPLVVGLTKPQPARSASTMASSSDAAALNKAIEQNVKENVTEAAPTEDNQSAPPSKQKKDKAPKQPKPQKAAAATAPTSPALIDLRVGHILRAIAHPNADSLYVSTIAMGDPEGTEHTQIDEETGKVVRTVCSGLNGLVPLEEMQNRKIIVVANLKPVNMRSIKSAAMVLAASPKQPEGADPHAADRIVELVTPPENAEAGDKVYFEGWPYGEGKGPEKQLNPKKKQWEAIQPGFYTGEDLVVGFDASQCEEVDGSDKGSLVVEGKGKCTVKTLKGAVVR